MRVTIPELCLVCLIGPSGSGKSTFARQHFLETEVISSDHCRALISDDENSNEATSEAFALLHYLAGKRLDWGKLTVIDATSVQRTARKSLVELARAHNVLPVAIVLNMPRKVCEERNRERPDRDFGRHVIAKQLSELNRSLRSLRREGFRHITVLNNPEEVAAVEIERQRLWNDRRDETGPFDIFGDIHGCADELIELMDKIGYTVADDLTVTPPEGRRAIFLGDLVDRGPRTPDVLRLVMGMVEAGTGICVPGNHDVKLMRALNGKNVKIAHGLAESLAQMEGESEEFRAKVVAFIDGLISHFVLDEGRLVVAHAGMSEMLQGRASGRVREFALYGDTTGETDEFGLPVRHNWAADYRGKALVVYGHTPVPEPMWLNRTVNIDTGCVFGGALTVLRYPERDTVSVPARRVHAEPIRPLAPPPDSTLSAQQEHDDLLFIEDVIGNRVIETGCSHHVTVYGENAAAALEVMSRFAVNPKWLIHLPPTMSPCETSSREDRLESPEECFAYYRQQGVERVICQEKHMGSRAIVNVCRDEAAATRRFGVLDEGIGVIHTRTGRPFFDNEESEQTLLQRIRDAATKANLWDTLETDWMCLDAEIMPWSAKAMELIRSQYAATGTAAQTNLTATVRKLEMARERGVEGVDALLHGAAERLGHAGDFRDTYRRYCWEITSLNDHRLAPFHLLASEGGVHADRDHRWHMGTLAQLVEADESPLLTATPHREVDTGDEQSIADAVAWWEERTAAGSEGMVVKPHSFIAAGKRGPVQPALKCRGREYLRIIYGADYTRPDNLERLRKRGLSHKRSLAMREFRLGMEALERFVRHEPLRRVHECVFGVLALESEPVDPRL